MRPTRAPLAARIVEAVLWIGYLKWHFRTHGRVQPLLQDFHNIECRASAPLLDTDGRQVTHWEARTTRTHPVTGEEPDLSNKRFRSWLVPRTV